jgi:hypothetical protein
VVHRRQHVHIRLPHHLSPRRSSSSPPVGITGLKERLDFFLPFSASQSEQDKDSKSTVTIIKGFLSLNRKNSCRRCKSNKMNMGLEEISHGEKGGIFVSENWNQLQTG